MRVKATVAYDGGGFHGFAINPGVRTVAGEITEALSKVSGADVRIMCAGRTDKGVHGVGQVISFDVSGDVDLVRLTRSVNLMCGPDIVLRDVTTAPPNFDARFSAVWRRYRYRVLALPIADPLLRSMAWHVPEPLDIAVMNHSAAQLLGTHDFSSFCRRPKVAVGEPEASLVRTVLDAEWRDHNESMIEFWIRATSFCHQMVRSIVGTAVDIGTGRLDESMIEILAAKDRLRAGRVAPPEGLTLFDVGY